MIVEVASIRLAYVDDPEVYAAETIMDWKKTDQGKWIMENALDLPEYNITAANDSFVDYDIRITANLSEEDYTFWVLKWGKW